MIDLSKLNLEELIQLQTQVNSEIETRKKEDLKEYTFSFEESNDPRKGVPYVAKLKIAEDGNKLDREFFNLNRQYGKKSVTVYGDYKAKDGDIIEIRTGGSWKNDYRNWYLINEGEQIHVADIDSSSDKVDVEKYLKNQITKEELIK